MHNTSAHADRLRRLAIGVLILSMLLLSVACGSLAVEPDTSDEPLEPAPTEVAEEAPEATELPASPTPAPTPTAVAATVTGTPVSGEYEAAAGYEGTATALGELEVEYPQAMDPATSNTVLASVYIPAMLASAEPARFERIPVNEDTPLAGELGLFHTTILVHPRIRAEITSPTLDFDPIFPATQDVNLDATLDPTTWVWTILAPETAGQHTFVLSLFHDDETVPAWVGSFTLEVPDLLAEDAAPTVAPEPSGFLSSLIESSGDILAAVLGLAAVIIPMIIGAKSKRSGKGWKFWKK